MEKITILNKEFEVTTLPMKCVQGAFFSVQSWSDTRIYSLSLTDSEVIGKSFEELLADPALLEKGTAMRAATPKHVPIVDTNVRSAILQKLGKSEQDFNTAMESADETFFTLYDNVLLSLFVGKMFNISRVVLDISTLTDGKFVEYTNTIDDISTKASTKEVCDFASAIQKTALSQAAQMLASLEDDEDDEEE